MRFLGLDIVGKNVPARRSTNIFDETYWEGQELGRTSTSGSRVTPTLAMQVGAVNACVRVIAETISSLPLILYRRDKNGNRERATDHPLYPVLRSWPNEWMTCFEWVELMTRHLLLRGNAYSEVLMKGGQIYGLLPLHPDKMNLSWVTKGKQKFLVYSYADREGTRVLAQDQVVHWRGPSEDGGKGKGPIEEAREVVGNAMTLDSYQSYFYANGTRLSGVLEHPNTLTDEASERIAKSFRDAYAGMSNSGKVAVLEEGMKLNTTSINLKDAEFIAVRKFSVREIARIFRVPPHMIGDLEDATFSNIEQESINFVVHSIRPWTVRIEQALMKTLLGEDETEEYFIEFLLDGLLRGDLKSRYEAYQIGLQNGFLKLNDVREKENMNSLDWGDASMIMLNMRPITSLQDLQDMAKDQKALPAPDKQKLLPAPDEKKDAVRMAWAEKRIEQSFESLFLKAFVAVTRREVDLLDQKFETKEEFDLKIRRGFQNLNSFVSSHFDPIITAYSDQLCLLADTFYRESTAVDHDFVSSWVSQYVDKRFDEIWVLAGDADGIAAWKEAARRTLHEEEIAPLLQTIKEHVLR